VLRDNLPAAFFGQLQGGFGFGLRVEQVSGLVSALNRASRAGELESRTVTIESYIFGGLHIFFLFFGGCFAFFYIASRKARVLAC
jgi:hypothetical protein